MRLFQSTRPCGARLRSLSARPRARCFNPRARVGRDVWDFSGVTFDIYVSIHAPVWGATFADCRTRQCQRVSIHAPVWGATRYGATSTTVICFNPRARVGRDLHSTANPRNPRVSIHAPVWGATPSTGRSEALQEFQSTRPCGARPNQFVAGREERCFNPRARVGRDTIGQRHPVLIGVSIHAPVWGATRASAHHLLRARVSIHAPVWGATWQSAEP